MFINNKMLKIIRQIGKFSIIGVIGVILNYITFTIFLIYLDINYLVAGFAGYLVPAIPVFLLNRIWTFNSNISI